MSIFVVHKHSATHLHYDLRLEMDGVLKSWAVPKEPPLEPDVKRLAVQVDDHALSYATFKGTIPKGSYGAGKVEIWDHGKYDLLERTDNKVAVVFHGKKLDGKYELVRFAKAGPKDWLFFKN